MEPPLAENRRDCEKERGMADAVPMAEVFRGGFLESVHIGHAVVARSDGSIVESWGDPDSIILPRSSAKMIQAIPMMDSGAGASLGSERLALACASHAGERRHVLKVREWLVDLQLNEDALRCGPQPSRDAGLFREMLCSDQPVTRAFNNCSGKHAGFLTLARHLKSGLDYVDPSHPVQLAVKEAFEDMTGMDCPGYGIDGCSAPNFATSVRGLARAMARFAVAGKSNARRDRSAAALRDAMMAHPELVSGKGRACAEIMVAAKGQEAVKTGAEGVYVAILPGQGLGVALKIADGATRASQLAIVGILVRLGALDPSDPVVSRYLKRPILNWDGIETGYERPAPALLS
jgi:L-asparaginase II